MASPPPSSSTEAAEASAAHAFVAQHLGETLAAFPPAVRDALVDKFVADYRAPLTAQLECVLRKRLTDDEVRHLLFAPTPTQYRFYADLLSLRAPTASGGKEDTASWQFVARKRFLTLFYLKHARNWPLVVEFVLRDGLQVLADLFLHDDLQMRGQAIDSFVQITSNPGAFEWFDAPVGYQARVLHAKMIALATPDAGFLRSAVANIRLYEEPNDSKDGEAVKRLPGGTLMLLQLLAFFLSWVRKLYTRNELRLSCELLTLLRDWAQRTGSDNEEELRLAQQVYEDFSRWPALEDARGEAESKPRGASTETHISTTFDGAVGTRSDVFARAKVDELMRLAETDDDYAERALTLCSEAIDAKLNALDALLCRAQVRFQQIRRARASNAVVAASTAEDAQLCLDDCRTVLAQEPGNMDAWKCQLGLLETMEMWAPGQDALDAWHARRETQDAFFSPEDVAFLTERHAYFDERAHEARQRAAAASTRCQHATREAKQQHVYQLLLQRTEKHSGDQPTPTLSTPRECEGPSETTEERTQAHTTVPAREENQNAKAAPRDVLARFRSSPSSSAVDIKKKKKNALPHAVASSSSSSSVDAPLGGAVKARAFVRKFTQCKRDARAVRTLLRSSRVQEVNAAVESALPEESLALVLEALVLEEAEDETKVTEAEHEALTRMLQHLLSLRRFELMREMAAPALQQQLDSAVQRAHDLLGTAWAA